MKIVGNNKISCCNDIKVLIVEENAPSIIKKKTDFDSLVTLTFD